MSPRGDGRATALARAGVVDTVRAERVLEALAPAGGPARDTLVGLLGQVADPDDALVGLDRLCEALPAGERDRLLGADTPGLSRVLHVLGASTALADHLVRHPQHWQDVAQARIAGGEELLVQLRADVAARPEGRSGPDALRVAYRRRLLQVAAVDLTQDAEQVLPRVAAALADLAAAALQVALDLAREEVEHADRCRLAVIGMGKCGGRELNYVSDVDVVLVAEPSSPQVPEEDALRAGAALATVMMRICAEPTGEGALWQVDAALRPEGKAGPLVRTVDSHRAYYERWAKTWEFQALLKARPVAGDAELGRAYLDAVGPMVWQACRRENFVEDVQAMRRRVEAHLPAAQRSREIKLGPGGLRDIEFSVQLLQLVHGRTDEHIRLPGTLPALEALSQNGYVGRTDAHELDLAYRRLRVLEHRIQLSRMRRTHLMPTSAVELRRLGRSTGLRADPAEQVEERRRELSRRVRDLHERLFYRPLLSAVARLDDLDARLSTQDAQDRLAALGFTDPAGAMRHLEALTTGVSRRAVMQRTLLPVMLQWFAQEADPDAGLLAFRRISEELGSSPWFLKQLRDGSGAEHLARVLARSRYLAQLLERSPSAVAMLGDPAALRLRGREAVLEQMRRTAGRHDDIDEAAAAVRAQRRVELMRVATADLVGEIGLDGVEQGITDATAAAVQALTDLAVRSVSQTLGRAPVTRFAVIGMGRFGGGEMGYSSDADVVFVHEPAEPADEQQAQQDALAVVTELRRLATLPCPEPPVELDADLRPEGRSGPLVRSLASYEAYYARWSSGWEAQALLRADPVAGDADLARRYLELVDPLRWPAGGITEADVRQIRRLKARMEAERIPRGGDRRTHVKLGLGGLSDVEWTVQLLQLQHARTVPGLRHTGTITPLEQAGEAGLVTAEQVAALREAWTFAGRVRNASVLWRGRPVDSLPSDLRDGDGIGRILGLPPASGPVLQETYLRIARHARATVEEVFYGGEAGGGRARPSGRTGRTAP